MTGAELLTQLRAAAMAKCGMTALSRRSGLNRETLYRILRADGNPRLSTLLSILSALNLRLDVSFISEDKSLPPHSMVGADLVRRRK